ncbi:MAG TPA: hypothetical protein IGS52_03410 [Oscillatoriaceae cyanobacterium M33_DOE_052]|uniref:Uncharacterized protein n=1 Tax=Planktothricoides sp. SpSt-374 TaxID=2282167 RepID=A0A7C3ZK68_9CYAN|nr:hypothetical protein [Oscillatoriaceae cyanobacterium M33_DOE_052]
MIQSELVTQPNQILQQDAELAMDWLQNIWAADFYLPAEFNWLGLADAAAANAYDSQKYQANSTNIKWAEIATKIYDRLAAIADKSKSGSGESLRISSMMLRAGMIDKFGVVDHHPVLDINIILQWFRQNLNLSCEEVEKKAANWRVLPVEEIRELRQLKNRLQVISAINDSNKFGLEPEIKAWLSLREKLP